MIIGKRSICLESGEVTAEIDTVNGVSTNIGPSFFVVKVVLCNLIMRESMSYLKGFISEGMPEKLIELGIEVNIRDKSICLSYLFQKKEFCSCMYTYLIDINSEGSTIGKLINEDGECPLSMEFNSSYDFNAVDTSMLKDLTALS